MKSTSSKKASETLKFIHKLLPETRKIILRYYDKGVKVESKADRSPVTIADRKVEEYLRKAFGKYTPDHGVVGEEFGVQEGTSGYQWVVDPIDGTKSFIHGVPLFATLIALLKKGKPILGAMDFPALGKTLLAEKGWGCREGKKICRVSAIVKISQACLLDGSSTTMEKKGLMEPWSRLRHQAMMHRGWGDCYGYYLVATGRAEAMVDPVANVWDLAAPMIVIQEAGGKFSGLNGIASPWEGTGVGSNGKIHGYLLKNITRNSNLV